MDLATPYPFFVAETAVRHVESLMIFFSGEQGEAFVIMHKSSQVLKYSDPDGSGC